MAEERISFDHYWSVTLVTFKRFAVNGAENESWLTVDIEATHLL